MTEAEWRACTDPEAMLEFLRDKASNRKVRLFLAACCRRVWNLLPDHSCREAVLVAERFADGNANDRERRAMRKQVAHGGVTDNLTEINARDAAFQINEKTLVKKGALFLGVAAVVGHAANPTNECGAAAYKEAYQAEEKAEASLVRCIFGNPFRPVTLNPAQLSWQDGTIPRLAASIYEERSLPDGTLDNARLGVLADALVDAGCSDTEWERHLRGAGTHVRGCWVVDAILGKN